MPTIKSYAKVNLALRVYRIRSGERLHRIDSIFALYKPLYDTIRIELSESDQVKFFGARIDADNTVTKALHYFRLAFGIKEHYRITVYKKIPIGSGLGGGSSNAGAVLCYLAKRCGISQSRLTKIAAKVGSDVPFFVSSYEQARVRGFGQIVKPVMTDWRVDNVVLSPTKSLTSEVYKRFEMLGISGKQRTINAFLKGLCLPFNDLQQAFLGANAPERQMLSQLRLEGHLALVSGSGSAIAVLAYKGNRIE